MDHELTEECPCKPTVEVVPDSAYGLARWHGHRWRFDGDDPYIVCDCGEVRDSISNRLIRPASSGDGGAPTACEYRPGTIGAESHCEHWHNAEDDVTPCCWCGSTEDDAGSCPGPAAPSPVSEEGPPTRPAMRWDGSRASLDRLCKWVNAGTDADDPLLAYTFYTATDAWDVTLETDSDFEGVEPGDWIVCDETGEFVVCRPGTPEQGEGPAK